MNELIEHIDAQIKVCQTDRVIAENKLANLAVREYWYVEHSTMARGEQPEELQAKYLSLISAAHMKIATLREFKERLGKLN